MMREINARKNAQGMTVAGTHLPEKLCEIFLKPLVSRDVDLAAEALRDGK
jgi:hypothetical protein